MNRKLLLCLAFCMMGALLPLRARTLTVYDGEASVNNVPIYGLYVDSYFKCEYVIPADDLAEMNGATINSLTWYLKSVATGEWNTCTFTVFVKEVDASTISAYSGMDGATVVYEGAISGKQETITIEFNNPYPYEGGNLLVGVYCTPTGSAYSGAYFYGVSATGASISGYSSSSMDGVTTNQRNFGPKTTLDYTAGGGPVYYKPTGLTVSDIKANEATLSWTAGSTETSWNVAYKKQADEEWITPEQSPVSTTSFKFEDLQNATPYDVRVQADYGDGNLSSWAVTSFTTPVCDEEDQGAITYSLIDEYGDGWSGNAIKVVHHDTGLVVATLTVPSGSSAEGTLNLCYGEAYDYVWVSGTYGGECTFTLTDPDGEVIVTHQGAKSGGTAPAPGVLTTYTIKRTTCPRPTALTASDIAYNAATLTWTPGNEEQDAWQLIYGTGDDFSPEMEGLDIIDVTGEPTYSMENLTENTTYHAYVRGSCAADDQSKWSDVCTFTTPLQFPIPTDLALADVRARSADVTWHGDADTYNLRYRPTNEGAVYFEEDFNEGIPTTWTKLDVDGDGKNWGAIYSDNNYDNILAYSLSYDNTTGAALTPDNWLITPKVTLDGTLTYKAGDVNQYHENYGVYVSVTGTNPEDFVALVESTTTTTPADLNDMPEYSIDLSAYEGQQGYIAFRHYNSSGNYYLFIDDVKIAAANGEEAEWTVVEGADEYPYTITGLTPETKYEVQVQGVYDDGVSQWTDSKTFTTKAADAMPNHLAVDDVTARTATAEWNGVQESYNLRYRTAMVRNGFFEGFENGIPDGWTLIDSDSDGFQWYKFNPEANDISTYDNNGNRTVLGTSCATSASYSGGVLHPDDWLITPLVDLQGTLSMWLRAQDPKYPEEHFAVYLSMTGNTVEDFLNADNEPIIELVPETVAQGQYVEYTADLSQYQGQQGYIAIRHFNSSDQFRLNLDNFYISAPTDIPAGEWVTIEDVSSPYTITGLDPKTEYEVQVQGVDIDGTTDWTLQEWFTTLETTEVTLAEFVYDGIDDEEYDVTDDLIMVAQTPDGSFTYVTDGEGSWARVADVPEGMFSTTSALAGVAGMASDMFNAPTINLTVEPDAVECETLDLENVNEDDVVICKVMTTTGYFTNGMLAATLESEYGITADVLCGPLEDGKQYDCVVAFEVDMTNIPLGGPRRVEAFDPYIKLVVLSADEVTVTGVKDLNVDKADVRYFDIHGRYIGRSLDNAPAGIYIGTDGSKVVK